MSDFDWRVDSLRSFHVWAAAKREMGVRMGVFRPQDERELRWANEGPRPVQELEAGRP